MKQSDIREILARHHDSAHRNDAACDEIWNLVEGRIKELEQITQNMTNALEGIKGMCDHNSEKIWTVANAVL